MNAQAHEQGLNMMPTRIPAVAYYRTSSATNVGPDKDSLERQRAAVRGCAERFGYELVGEYYDAAVSGADPIDERRGFKDMMETGPQIIIVETANRFARDLIVQETGWRMLKERGIELIAADSPESFTADTPTAVLVRQILGAVAEFDKAMTVTKLRAARDRKSKALGRRCEGRKPAPEIVIEQARHDRALGASLREIAAKLADAGYFGPNGRPYGPSSVRSMVRGN